MMTTHEMVIEQDRMFTENANKAVNMGIITPQNLRPFSKNPIIANFFHQIGRADELGSGVRNLYHYVRIYSGADPIFDEGDVFRLTVPLDDDYSPEKGHLPKRGTTQQATQKIEPHKSNGNHISQPHKLKQNEIATQQTTQQTTLQGELKARLGGVTLDVALLMAQQEGIKISEIAERVGLTRDGVNYHIRILKKKVGLTHQGANQSGRWTFDVH